MLKLVINYDMISKINECNGKYKLVRYYKRNKITGLMSSGFIAADIIRICNGDNVGKSIGNAMWWIIYYFAFVPMIDYGVDRIRKKHDIPTFQEKSMDDIKKLASQLRDQHIDTTYEMLLNSKVYHRKYKLDMYGAPGIIRERYINIPIYDYNRCETSTSILEEHKLGSKKYILTIGSPKKRVVLKKAYGI